MDEMQKEQEEFSKNIAELGSKKNRYFAVTYRTLGSILGSLIVAGIVLALIYIF